MDDPSSFKRVVDFNTEKVKNKKRAGKAAAKLKKMLKQLNDQQQNDQWSDNSSNSEFGNIVKGIDNDF